MKILVDSAQNLVRGVYLPPLNFSISGHLVIDVPQNTNIDVIDNIVADAVNMKLSAYTGLFPGMSQITPPGTGNDEFLDTTEVDVALSNRIIAGGLKRTAILPGGILMTTGITIPAITLNNIVAHCYAFLLYRNTGPSSVTKPPPSPMLYNFDPTIPGFVEFVPSVFTIDLMDSTGTIVLVPNITADKVTAFVNATPITVRLRFINNSPHTLYMSDWILLVGP